MFLFRHGETEWSLAGKHTGRTDIPLTTHGQEQAKALKPVVRAVAFSAVFCSPLQRARETARLAEFSNVVVDDNLAEIDYGAYEGLATRDICENVPNWTVWTKPCPQGETLEQAATRVRMVIERACSLGGNVALIAHGHILRILTATWLQLEPAYGRYFMLDTSSTSVLSHEHQFPAIKIWNSPIDLPGSLGRVAKP